MPLSAAQRAMNARAAALAGWSQVGDRTARTQVARDAFMSRFDLAVDPEGVLPPEERARRAEAARRAYFVRLALKSSQARAARKGP
jgi:hypothetical protein